MWHGYARNGDVEGGADGFPTVGDPPLNEAALRTGATHVLDVSVVRRDRVFPVEETLPAAEVLVPYRREQLGDFRGSHVPARSRPLVNRTERAVVPGLGIAHSQQYVRRWPQLGELAPLPAARPVDAGLVFAQLNRPVDVPASTVFVPQPCQFRMRPNILHLKAGAEAEQL